MIKTYLLSELKHYWAAVAIFLAGSLLTIATYIIYKNEELNQIKIQFDRLAESRLLLIQEQINETVQQFEFIKQLFSVSKAAVESHQIFHIITHNSLIIDPNIVAIGWIEKKETSHTKETSPAAAELYFASNDLEDPRKNQFFPVDLLELGYIRKPFYFNLDDFSKFEQAYNDSLKSPSLVVSNPIRYFQDGEKTGVFFFNPVFDETATPVFLKGTVVGFTDLNTIVDTVRSNIIPVGINFIFYLKNEEKETPILFSPSIISPDPTEIRPDIQATEESWSVNRFIKVGNQTWKLSALPTAGYLVEHTQKVNWIILIIGFSTSFLTSIYFLNLVNRRILIEQQVQQRTEELARINRMLQGEIHSREIAELATLKKQNYLQKRHEALEELTKLKIYEIRLAIHDVIEKTAAVMQIDRVSIWFKAGSEGHLMLSCAGLYSQKTNTFTDNLEFDSKYFPNYFQVLTLYKDLIIPSLDYPEVNQELASYLSAFNIISKLDIPIIFEGKLLGVLCCEETRFPREWDLDDHHFGHTIADIVAIMLEQEARVKAETAITERDERIKYITKMASDAIISVNKDKKIIIWNYGAEQMYGYTEQEMMGKPLTLVIPEQNLMQMTNKPFELISKNKNGEFFPIELSFSQWKIGDEQYDTVIIRDITERKENEKKLIKAMREATAANRAKSEFLTVVSHELRTPLNAVIGYNQCLLMEMDGSVTKDQKASLKKIEKSSFHLLSLINDILDLSKIEASKMELEISTLNIVETLVSCVDEVQSLASQKNLRIQTYFEKPYILMEFDKTRIRQVIINLLSNAIKFTEKGSIKVMLNNFADHIEIQIEDTGIGISTEDLSKLFSSFSQADSSITRKYGGTGLGLAISKKIVELHSGTIEVTSTPGKGSIFIVKLSKIQ